MSTQAAHVEARQAVRLRAVVTAAWFAPAALGVLSLALVLVTWNTWGNPASDTGYDTLAGVRVAHGSLPYVDFPYYYGPLAPFGLGLASLLGGAGMWPSIGFGLVIALAIVFATYELARSVAGPLGGFLAGALTAAVAFSPNELSFVNPHTTSATLGVLTALGFLLCLRRYAASPRLGWLVATGSWAGLSALTRYEFAAAVFVAAAVWLALRVRDKTAGRREVAALVAPAVAIPAVVYGAFLSAVSFHQLMFENLYPTDFLNSTGKVVLRSRMPWTISSFVSLGGKLVLYALGVAALLLAARLLDRDRRTRRVLIAVGVLAGVVVLAVSIKDPEALRHVLEFAYGWIPAGAVLVAVVLLWRYRKPGSSSNWNTAAQTALALTVALAVVAATTYNGFFIEAFMPQMAVYVLPLAAAFLAWLHLRALAPSRTAFALGAVWLSCLVAATTGLVLKDASAETATIHGAGGSIAVRPADAPAYRAAVAAIERNTRPGDAVLLAPQLTWLYTLTERTNPLPELSLLPGVLAKPGSETRAIERLKAANVRLVVTDIHPFPAYGVGSFGGSFDRALAGWIDRSFTRVSSLRVGDTDATLEIRTRTGS